MSGSVTKSVCFGRLVCTVLLLVLTGGVLCAQTLEHQTIDSSTTERHTAEYQTSELKSAKTSGDEVKIYFRPGSGAYEPDYQDNAARLESFAGEVSYSSSNYYLLDSILVISGTSPEGPLRLNERLASERLSAVLGAVRAAFAGKIAEGDSVTFASDSRVGDWSDIIAVVASDTSSVHRADILSVLLDGNIASLGKERSLRSRGGVWNYLKTSIFPDGRATTVCIRRKHNFEKMGKLPEITSGVTYNNIQQLQHSRRIGNTSSNAHPVNTTDAVRSVSEDRIRKITVKSNALALGLLIGNAAVEADITDNLSFQLPVYYSALNYFTSTIKFRTFALQPELRWNFTKPDGLFVGAHFGLAYFNLAADGNWRIQTHDGNRPLIGGGLSVGYKLPITKDKRWNVEFSLGAGAYRFHYDKFYNEPNGALAGSVKRTYIGLDNAGVSFSYSFDLGRGGRR